VQGVMPLVSDPLAGYMTVKLGRRPVIMFAVITTAMSHIGLAYAKTLPAMLIVYTIPSGMYIGKVLIYLIEYAWILR